MKLTEVNKLPQIIYLVSVRARYFSPSVLKLIAKATSFLRFIKEIFALGIDSFYVHALSIASFQHSISKLFIIVHVGSLQSKIKLKPETSESTDWV